MIRQDTLTVREVARMFEQAGTPRTERSIINWCQPNRQGVARLDAFFDENEHRCYLTPESVNRAIEEERARANATAQTSPAETDVPKASETARSTGQEPNDSGQTKELERKNRDLEIATRGKDLYIEQLEKDRVQAIEKMIGMSRYVGELETQVRQLGSAPSGNLDLPKSSEGTL